MEIIVSQIPPLTAQEVWAIAGAVVFMGMDMVVGLVGAILRHAFSSTKMREGLGHKAVLLLIVLLAVLVQEFTALVGDLGFSVPVVYVVCVSIIVMEIGSCVENVTEAYPELKETKVLSAFSSNEEGE